MMRSLALALLCAATVSGAVTNGYADQNGGTTGGEGGQSVTVSTGKALHQAICDRAAVDTPLIIYVSGTITLANTDKVKGKSCTTDNDRIELKRIKNLSIIGKGTAIFDQVGIHIRESSNIILQNLHIRNVKKSNGPTSNGGDAIGMEKDVSNVWVDHCTLEASGGESDGYDGLCDMKKDTKYVTVSYTVFMNSGRGGLVGSGDSDLNNGPVTFHHNSYSNIDSRVPLLRGAIAHSYNNLFDRINKSGMNARAGGKIRVENNYIQNSKNPLGTFYTNKKGSWDARGNIFKSVTWTDSYYPAGPNVKSTTSFELPYAFALDAASCVPDVVRAAAGAGKGIKFTDGSCRTTSSPSAPVSPSTPATPSTPPSPPTPPSPSTFTPLLDDGIYTISAKIGGKLLEPRMAATNDGASVVVYKANNMRWQQWWLTHLGDGYYRILNAYSWKAMDVYGYSYANGGDIAQWRWTGVENQQWMISRKGSHYILVNRHSGKALDLYGGSLVDGANIVQWEVYGGDTQLFAITKA